MYPGKYKKFIMKVYFEKEAKNNCKETKYSLDGFAQEGFNKNGFEFRGFGRNEFSTYEFNRNKKLFLSKVKVEQAIEKNPWYNFLCKQWTLKFWGYLERMYYIGTFYSSIGDFTKDY